MKDLVHWMKMPGNRQSSILQGLSGGSRLVGIISHVTELKEQIEQKLVDDKRKIQEQSRVEIRKRPMQTAKLWYCF